MKITTIEPRLVETKVIIEMTGTEAAHLADDLLRLKLHKEGDWPVSRTFAKDLIELAGQW